MIRMDYTRAESLYDEGIQRSRAAHDCQSEARCLFGKAGIRAARLDYAGSVSLYLAAKTAAGPQVDSQFVSAVGLGLYNVYAGMGDQEVAIRYLRQAAMLPLDSLDPPHRLRIAINLANGCSAERRSPDCTRLFYQAIDDSIDAGDLRSLAYCRRMLGNHFLRLGDVGRAAGSLTEAFRLRLLGRGEDLSYSYLDLAQLRIAEKNFSAALVMSDRALQSASGRVQAPRQTIYHVRGLANVGLKRYTRALADFDSALMYARDWRSSVIPADSSLTGSSLWVHNIYSDYIAAGMQVYAANQDERLAALLFAAAEENRAASFREKLLSRIKLPVEYWETLARLRIAEHPKTGQSSQTLDTLRLQLTEMEARAGVLTNTPVHYPHSNVENFASEESLTHYKRILGPEEALLSFHAGRTESYLWAITSRSFEVHVLPGREEIASRIYRARAALDHSAADYPSAANQLYRAVFGPLSSAIERATDWILVLDDPLFEVPFAALVTRIADGRTPVYLAQSHSIRVIPAAAMLDKAPRPSGTGIFVAIGDPVFNTADQRWITPTPHTRPSLPGMLTAGPAGTLQLNRLAGTGAEIRLSARNWDPQGKRSILLDGLKARRRELLSALANSPDVVHFATHVVQGDKSRDSAYLSLSLDPDGQADFLTPAELANWKLHIGLVTLSACSSGAGNSYPGAGLFGLTRAWLLAGAQAVVGTHWPVADDSGEFFRPFYSVLRSGAGVSSRAVAHALRAAQLDMLNSGSWRAHPRYWAAFFVMGRD